MEDLNLHFFGVRDDPDYLPAPAWLADRDAAGRPDKLGSLNAYCGGIRCLLYKIGED